MGIPLKQVTTLDADSRVMTNLGAPSDGADLARKSYVDGEIGTVPTNDKAQVPAATSGDEQTTSLTITSTPLRDSYVQVLVNGSSAELGDGVKTADCYFSADGGTTARDFEDIASGDTLYWNGVVATFDLATSDLVDFCYMVGTSGVGSPQTGRLIMFDERSSSVPGVMTAASGERFGSVPAANAGVIVDVSSFVPVGTTHILVNCTSNWFGTTHPEASNGRISFRKPGESGTNSDIAHTASGYPGAFGNTSIEMRDQSGHVTFIPLDSNRQFEEWFSSTFPDSSFDTYVHEVFIMGYVI